MIANGASLVALSPVEGMIPEKRRQHGVSYGLAEVGYDIRIRQAVTFEQGITGEMTVALVDAERNLSEHNAGRFCIASTVERFTMPDGLAGVVHDKSTWARRGLSVFNTVIEPGWEGWLTLELVYHGSHCLHIPAGAGIAQVLFHRIEIPAAYAGKYQGQADEPVAAIFDVLPRIDCDDATVTVERDA